MPINTVQVKGGLYVVCHKDPSRIKKNLYAERDKDINFAVSSVAIKNPKTPEDIVAAVERATEKYGKYIPEGYSIQPFSVLDKDGNVKIKLGMFNGELGAKLDKQKSMKKSMMDATSFLTDASKANISLQDTIKARQNFYDNLSEYQKMPFEFKQFPSEYKQYERKKDPYIEKKLNEYDTKIKDITEYIAECKQKAAEIQGLIEHSAPIKQKGSKKQHQESGWWTSPSGTVGLPKLDKEGNLQYYKKEKDKVGEEMVANPLEEHLRDTTSGTFFISITPNYKDVVNSPTGNSVGSLYSIWNVYNPYQGEEGREMAQSTVGSDAWIKAHKPDFSRRGCIAVDIPGDTLTKDRLVERLQESDGEEETAKEIAKDFGGKTDNEDIEESLDSNGNAFNAMDGDFETEEPLAQRNASYETENGDTFTLHGRDSSKPLGEGNLPANLKYLTGSLRSGGFDDARRNAKTGSSQFIPKWKDAVYGGKTLSQMDGWAFDNVLEELRESNMPGATSEGLYRFIQKNGGTVGKNGKIFAIASKLQSYPDFKKEYNQLQKGYDDLSSGLSDMLKYAQGSGYLKDGDYDKLSSMLGNEEYADIIPMLQKVYKGKYNPYGEDIFNTDAKYFTKPSWSSFQYDLGAMDELGDRKAKRKVDEKAIRLSPSVTNRNQKSASGMPTMATDKATRSAVRKGAYTDNRITNILAHDSSPEMQKKLSKITKQSREGQLESIKGIYAQHPDWRVTNEKESNVPPEMLKAQNNIYKQALIEELRRRGINIDEK